MVVKVSASVEHVCLTPRWLAFFSGGLMVLSFAPFAWFFMAPLAFAGLLHSLRNATPREGFWRGWLFGIGLFGGGVWWIRISLNEFGNIDTWLAWLLTAVFIAVLALYSGVSGWLARSTVVSDQVVKLARRFRTARPAAPIAANVLTPPTDNFTPPTSFSFSPPATSSSNGCAAGCSPAFRGSTSATANWIHRSLATRPSAAFTS